MEMTSAANTHLQFELDLERSHSGDLKRATAKRVFYAALCPVAGYTIGACLGTAFGPVYSLYHGFQKGETLKGMEIGSEFCARYGLNAGLAVMAVILGASFWNFARHKIEIAKLESMLQS